MKTFQYKIQCEEGLHATPAGTLVSIAKCYRGSIYLIYQDQRVNLKKLLPVLGAGLKKGDLIEIEIKGFREEECCKYLQRAFQEVL
ncbi:HPr family phosphocarrier [Eggerthia catenaformis OT 569 = DSM 20559]|uniref:HPr family phosphocarrier n=1 Tax=Eggerthia catenaformis OT 569 = DSM 20559 TaxID=999415 RepID=M2Q3Z2_9FIRM|nr:HPr family phosphocarrier protein [Eggerthia catenaformis]EMD17590.1 HPr family phosphocarrier [Eggerthia catenaformis OT 569 = DSM 20559]OUC51003.1 hypothetical protein B7939_08840 [Eggerthia catenaformis]